MSSAFSIAVDLNIAVLGMDAISNLTSKLANIQTALQNINSIGLRGFTGSLTAASEKVAALSAQMDGLTKTRTANVIVRQTGTGTASAGGSGGGSGGGTVPLIASGHRDDRGFRFNELGNITMAGFAINELTHGLGALAERAGHVQSEIARLRLQGFTESEVRAQRAAALRISGEVYGASESDAMQTHRKLGGIFGDEHVSEEMTKYALSLQKAGQTMGTPESAEEFFKHFAQTVEAGGNVTTAGHFDPGKALQEMQRVGQRYLAAGGDLSMQTIQHTARMSQTWIKGSGLSNEDAGAMQNAASLRFGEQGGDWLNTFMRDTSGAGLQKNGLLMSVLGNVHPELFDTSRRQIVGANKLNLGGGELQEIRGDILRMPQGMNALDKGQLIMDSIYKIVDQMHQRTDGRNATDAEKQAAVGEVLGPEAAQVFMNILGSSFKATMDKQKESIAKISNDPKEISRLGRTPAMAMAEFSAKLDNVIGNLIDFSHSLEFLDALSRGMQKTALFFNEHPVIAQAASMAGEATIAVVGTALIGKMLGGIGRLVGFGAPAAAASGMASAIGAGEASAVTGGLLGVGAAASRILGPLKLLATAFLAFQAFKWLVGGKEDKNAPKGADSNASSFGLLDVGGLALGAFQLAKLGVSFAKWLPTIETGVTVLGGVFSTFAAANPVAIAAGFAALIAGLLKLGSDAETPENRKKIEANRKAMGSGLNTSTPQDGYGVDGRLIVPPLIHDPYDKIESNDGPASIPTPPSPSPSSPISQVIRRQSSPQEPQIATSWFNMGGGQFVTNAPGGLLPAQALATALAPGQPQAVQPAISGGQRQPLSSPALPNLQVRDIYAQNIIVGNSESSTGRPSGGGTGATGGVSSGSVGQSPIASAPPPAASTGEVYGPPAPPLGAGGNDAGLYGPPTPLSGIAPASLGGFSPRPSSAGGSPASTVAPAAEGATGGLSQQLGVAPQEYDTFRNSIAKIESNGDYGVMGGSSGRFAGRYQMGATEISESAQHLGMKPPSREEFLKNPALQEKLFERYTQDHDNYLRANNPKYAAMTPQQKLAVLGYAHNQGAGGASKWLNSGLAGRDAFGTSGTAYSSSITQNLRNNEAQRAMQGAASSMPTGNPAQAAQVAESLSGPSVSKSNYENQPTNTHTNPIMMNLHLDGEIVARNTFDRVFDLSPAGLSGLTGFDTRQNPLPPGVSVRG